MLPRLRPIDFRLVRERIPLREVLRHLGWKPSGKSRDYLRGPCPVHHSRSPTSRSLSVAEEVCMCFKCHFQGDAVQLWGRLKMLRPLEAAYDLCREFGVEPPVLA